ncbi:MAG: hypothetical protein PVF45_11955, partial [Anaerolineae bacterium]
MPEMAAKRRERNRVDWRADWWLWPSALLLVMGGWGQALWTWENVPPEGLAPMILLLWVGVGVAGVTLPIYWCSRRWWPIAWLTVAAWMAVPILTDLASGRGQAAPKGDEWWYGVWPLLSLLLLGVGLSGVMMTVSWFAGRRWPGPVPNVRPLRQGAWSGLFAMICGWLLINRVFSLIP